MELLRFVYKNFCENKRLLIFIIMGNFLTFVLALVVPYLNGFYFNIVIYTPSKEKIIKFGCLIVGLGVITTMLTYCFNIYKTKVQSQLVFKTMNEIIRCVQYSDYSESSKFNPSYLHQKINIDANKIWSFVFDNIISSVFQSLTIIGVIIAIGKINKKIFLLIMFIVPAYILSYYYLKKPLYEQSTRYKEEQSAYYKHINEQFEFIKKIKLWADYKNKENKRRREFGKYLEKFMKYTKLSYFYNSLESIITLVFKSTALIVGGIEMISGNLTLGEFLIISSYFGMLIQSIKFFFFFGQVYQDAKNSFDWITKIKNLEKEQYGTKIVNQKINRVKISRLEFSYDNKKILTNYNEEFMEGINLIMGANGSGKSTLLYLLCGLLHTKKKGNIEFNNIPISEVEIESLRKNKISIYIQNQNEMDITVKEMLAERFDIGALEILIKQYHLENIYLTNQFNILHYLDRAFHELSGGEMQRIQLLPVLLKNTDIMILDEPTSDLDMKTKEILSEILWELGRERIIFIVTHERNLFERFSDIKTIYLK
ncbi:ATP-binding cassette domain-containing protein [Coprococcus comes]|uniref:ATP-binding cassette domain-containing protein n=1 Tax=Coprococcus comes TaxID=410072 RepID=UPI0034A39620